MIKYIFLFSVLLSFVFPSLAFQPSFEEARVIKDKPTKALSISPPHLFKATIDGKYLLKMSEHIAFILPFSIGYMPEGISTFNPMLMLSGGAGLRYFFAQEALIKDGFFMDAGLIAGYSRITPNMRASYSSFFVQPSARIGYSWVLFSGLALNLALGTFYNHSFSDEAEVIKKTSSGLDKYILAANGFINNFGPEGELSLSYHW
jgi:hypothetical protein